ncbi:MAG TPA: peptidylprolyl isomerase, partial [Candidatus Baltobacteraceae bacterium]|nr:peptidylprolyl isomerase [Candidatus Baltobacteraceae bacterium]
ELQALVAKMTAKKPDERYTAPAEVADALDAITTSRAGSVSDGSSARRLRFRLVGAALFSIAALIVAAIVILRISTDKGDMVFTFFPDDAPMHSAAFIKLTEAGFYDGLVFHRVEPGFVIQGGDPDGDGTGGPGYRLKAEFNSRPHVRGTLAMARASNPDSAGSQFYICLADARFLDNEYTVFGEMTDGFETLDAIRRGDKMQKLAIEPSAK